MYKIAKHLAWLSIWRRKTRSLMVIMMIALSLSGLLGLQGIDEAPTAAPRYEDEGHWRDVRCAMFQERPRGSVASQAAR